MQTNTASQTPNGFNTPTHTGYSNLAGIGPSVPQNTSQQKQPPVPPPPVPKQQVQVDYTYPNIGGSTSMSSPLNGMPATSSLGGNPF